MERIMRILWFTNTPSLAAAALDQPVVGGGWIESLERRIRNRPDVELAVAFCHGKGAGVHKFTDRGSTYYALPNRQKGVARFVNRHLNRSDDKDIVASCMEVIADFKPDIINIFGTEKAFGLVAERTAIPVVIHLQGILTLYEKKWFPAGINQFTLFRYSGLKPLLKANSLLHHYYAFKQAAIREQKIFRINKYFMGRTDWDRRAAQTMSPGSSYFISHEILRDEFYTGAWNKKALPARTFISTIQANIFKGLETVLECAALLKALNEFEFKWIIAGTTPDEKIVRLFEDRTGVKCKDVNIVLEGRLNARELLRKELGSDIFIHPSHIDNSPNSVCEAMLLGMPVIATASGGTSSLLTDREEGLLIQDGDAYAMAGAILDLTRDPHYAGMLGQNARKRATRRHAPEEIAGQVMDIYTEILRKRPAPAIRSVAAL